MIKKVSLSDTFNRKFYTEVWEHLTLRSSYVRESKTVLDSRFHPWIADSMTGFRILSSVELGFWIPIVSVIPKSLSCIPDSKAQDSGFSYMGRRITRVIILDWRLPGIKECSNFSTVYKARKTFIYRDMVSLVYTARKNTRSFIDTNL